MTRQTLAVASRLPCVVIYVGTFHSKLHLLREGRMKKGTCYILTPTAEVLQRGCPMTNPIRKSLPAENKEEVNCSHSGQDFAI